MLNYTITIAISAFFVPHYLGGLFFPALKHGPGDVIFGIGVVAVLGGINIVGVSEAAALIMTEPSEVARAVTAIGIEPTHPSLEARKARPLVRRKIVADPAAIRAFIEAHATDKQVAQPADTDK